MSQGVRPTAGSQAAAISADDLVDEILAALRDSRVLDTFRRLPEADQTNFLRWIASTEGHDARDERTATLIAALEESPLANPPPERR